MVVDTTELPPDQEAVIGILISVSGALSAIGCLFIIVSYCLFRVWRHFHLRLILFLTICDLAACITSIFGTKTRREPFPPIACYSSAALLQLSSLSSFLWTACIAHTLDQVIRKGNDKVERFEKYYHLICWGIPIGCDIYLWLTHRLGDADLWCWILPGQDAYRFGMFYIPLSLVIVYNVITYFMVTRKLKKEQKLIVKVMEDNNDHTIQTSFRWFLLVLLVCWVPAIANRIQNYLYPNSPIFWLYCLHGFFSPLQGLLNSVIYGFNDELRRNYRRFFDRNTCCCCKGNNYAALSVQEKQAAEQWSQHYNDVMREYDQND